MKLAEAGKTLWRGVFGQVPEMTPHQLRTYRQAHHEGSYVLLDVRQPGEYQKGHLPGATLIPLPQLSARVSELDPKIPTIAY